jgi:hypothetical protein
MDQTGFDSLAKALSDGAGSRRRVLQVAGAALVGAPLLALFPDSASGSGKKRCKKKHGVYLRSGECNCAVTWRKGTQAPWKFRCENTDGCGCYQTVDGSGFCAKWEVVDSHHGCESDAVCDPGEVCTVLRGYSSGASCDDTTPCDNPRFGCINGTCQYTSCRPACSS